MFAHQRVGLARRQRRQPELADAAVAPRRLERRENRRRQLARPEGESGQDPRRSGPPQQVHDQLQRSLVGPVDVVEHEHHGLPRGELLEQRAHCAMRPEALVLEPADRRAAGSGRRRQHACELGQAIPDEPLHAVGPQRGDVVIERGHPDAERQLALHLRSAPDQHQVPARLRACTQLRQQARLAGTRLAGHRHPPGSRGLQLVERGGQARQLLATPDDRPFPAGLGYGHDLLSVRRSRSGRKTHKS